MNLTLSENIRALRKQRKLTQEKLAEALGVTVGAVYKWESGQSLPELNLLVELADFFDSSVDALLGYRMKDNRLDSVLERLNGYCRTLDPAALAEAEKALGRYPHSFPLVYTCAKVYLAFGAGDRDPARLRRALELLEQAQVLLPQNDDARISEATLCGDLAAVWFLLDERAKGVELLKRSNAGGMFSSQIGLALALFMDRPEEAASFLSEAMLDGMSTLLSVIIGYVFVFRSRGDWASALDLISWGTELLSGLKEEAKSGALDKTSAELLTMLAYAQAKAGKAEASRESLRKARSLAARFDSTPDYSLQAMRFAEHMEQITVYDIFGATAAGSVERVLALLGDEALSAQWKELNEDGQ